MGPKRLCCFTEKLEKEFPFIQKLKPNNDFDIHCTICLSNFSVTHSGKTDITGHLKTNKHKNAKETVITSNKVSDFFMQLNANDKSLKLAAKELTLAFHTYMHNHSFNSMTCTADLIRHLFT